MPRYRLRYQATDLEMPEGDFVVGRSSTCSLALDDALVSRRHAAFHVSTAAVTVQDLGSRNGVSVNGERITGRVQLRHLDRVTIGSQEMVLIELQERGPSDQPTGEFAKIEGAATTLSGATLEIHMGGGSDAEDETRTADTFQIIANIAEKALALGRFDEAERMLSQHLATQLRRAESGTLPPENLTRATGLALRLAAGLSRPAWITFVFKIHEASGTLVPAAGIDALYELARRLRYTDVRALRSYLGAIGKEADALGPADRFLLKRLEGLERLITA